MSSETLEFSAQAKQYEEKTPEQFMRIKKGQN